MCTPVDVALIERCSGRARQIPLRGTQLTFGRTLDDTSICTLTFRDSAAECCPVPLCGGPIEWAHELAVYEQGQPGRTREPVWIGPVAGVFTDPTIPDLVLRAFDRSVWWYGPDDGSRTVAGFELQAGEVTDTGGNLWRRAYDEANALQDDGLTVYYHDEGTTAGFTLTVRQGDPIRDIISDLTNLGTRWTVAGRRLLVGRETAPHGGVLRGAEWQDGGFPTESDGFGIVNYATVRNRDNTISASHPVSLSDAAAENRCRYGLHQRTFEVDVATLADAEQLAEQIVAERSMPTLIASTGDGTLAADASLELCDAIPGRWFRTVTEPGACVPVDRDQRLTGVEVTATDGEVDRVRLVSASAPLDLEDISL